MLPEKTCTKCLEKKLAMPEFFGPHRLGKFGLHARCRDCEVKRHREFRKNVPYDVRRRDLKKSRKNSEAYAARNPEKSAERSRDYRTRNLEKTRSASRERSRRRVLLAPDLVRRMANKTRKERLATDPTYKLRCVMSTRLFIVASRAGGKSRTWERLVGYSANDLRLHLELQFAEWMNWDNYGSLWEIDHIRPVASFRFSSTDDPEFRECWALTNLRPLARPANRAKSASLEYLI